MSDLIPTLADLHALKPTQQPEYADEAEVARVTAELRQRPPLVFAGECDELRAKIANVADGRAFLLQGGDCAETFDSVTANGIRNKLRVLLSMAVVLTYSAQVPVVKVGRLAGQYAKPRSNPNETRGDVTLPAYRGDAVNSLRFDAAARRHDPHRLVEVYNHSAATLNLVRAFTKGGFADIRSIHMWNSDFVRNNSKVGDKYEALTAEIDNALAFMVACGVDDESFRTVDFYSSHEALILEYEHALTRIDSRSRLPYVTSGHLLWIGERTRLLGGAHVELLAAARNPVGVKVGPAARPDDIVALADRLDPGREPGRLTFISRMGADRIREALPPIVAAVERTGRKVAWVCDPMHGNTFESANGYKTRAFSQVLEEVDGFFAVHEALGTWPGGIHMELTGDDVTECVGGIEELAEEDLSNRYESACDPRLNRNQSLELAFEIAERLAAQRRARGSNPVQDFQPVDF
ncbi:class II 3-deoxy-7-phosphoheptulonate synthase [Propionicicella superfundia]|uniref:class II 3-deoxy-7-phosphoheptulonate synthase n=1 Tax=Propionicicella superfundia TaxID=348582 RepID=UPI00041275AE|nr:3-deoxy-7-phosphoheptulonate synthase class II [Propionicicella superfundia]